MHIHNIYVDDKGESHFRDMEIEWVKDMGYGQLSERFPATGIIFKICLRRLGLLTTTRRQICRKLYSLTLMNSVITTIA